MDASEPRSGPGYGGENVPLVQYGILTAGFLSGLGATLLYADARGLLPERLSAADTALLGISSYKIARLISRDTVTSFVRAPFVRYRGTANLNELQEEARGKGWRRAIGELVVCPPCTGQWVIAGLAGLWIYRPRLARYVASVFTAYALSDLAQVGYSAALKAWE